MDMENLYQRFLQFQAFEAFMLAQSNQAKVVPVAPPVALPKAVQPQQIPTSRSVRLISSDQHSPSDNFLRFDALVTLSKMDSIVSSAKLKASVLVNSGASSNYISREFYDSCLRSSIPVLNSISGRVSSVALASSKTAARSGDLVILNCQIETIYGPVHFQDRFYLEDSSSEPLSIGVHRFRDLLGHPGFSDLIFPTKNHASTNHKETNVSSDASPVIEPPSHNIRSVDVDSSISHLVHSNRELGVTIEFAPTAPPVLQSQSSDGNVSNHSITNRASMTVGCYRFSCFLIALFSIDLPHGQSVVAASSDDARFHRAVDNGNLNHDENIACAFQLILSGKYTYNHQKNNYFLWLYPARPPQIGLIFLVFQKVYLLIQIPCIRTYPKLN